MSSSVSAEVCGPEVDGSMGKLNWTDLAILDDGWTERLLTVSMTFRHLATVVEMAVFSSPADVVVAVVTHADGLSGFMRG